MRNTLDTADTMQNNKHVEIKHMYAHVAITVQSIMFNQVTHIAHKW